jgi:hypothetical protein
MPLPLRYLSVLGLAGIAAVATTLGRSARPRSTTSSTSALPTAVSEWKGVGTCSAAGCHGAPGGPGDDRAAYTTWLADDPHSRAYEVLLTERSLRIARALIPPTDTPETERRCLDCHVDPKQSSFEDVAMFSVRDGVGCESCHGASGRWLEPHSRPGWSALPAARKRASGLTPLDDLDLRAETCVACHVGAPGREVGHDLIAAGHPRLAFELTSYMAQVPNHWGRSRTAGTTRQARTWAAGRRAAESASKALLAAHRHAANLLELELADYDCFACHHTLSGSPRSSRTLPAALRPNAWYSAWRPGDAPNFDRLRAEFLAQATERPLNWDEAAQLYLALAALQDPPSALLKKLEVLLRFPEGSDSPTGWTDETQKAFAAALSELRKDESTPKP